MPYYLVSAPYLIEQNIFSVLWSDKELSGEPFPISQVFESPLHRCSHIYFKLYYHNRNDIRDKLLDANFSKHEYSKTYCEPWYNGNIYDAYEVLMMNKQIVQDMLENLRELHTAVNKLEKYFDDVLTVLILKE